MGLFNGYHKGKHEEHLQHIDNKLGEISDHMSLMDNRLQRVERVYWLLGGTATILIAAAPFGPDILAAFNAQ